LIKLYSGWFIGEQGCSKVHLRAERQKQIPINLFLWLDGFGVAEYVGLHDVGFSVRCGLGRASHHGWLGPARAGQLTFTPESRPHGRSQQKPY